MNGSTDTVVEAIADTDTKTHQAPEIATPATKYQAVEQNPYTLPIKNPLYEV